MFWDKTKKKRRRRRELSIRFSPVRRGIVNAFSFFLFTNYPYLSRFQHVGDAPALRKASPHRM